MKSQNRSRPIVVFGAGSISDVAVDELSFRGFDVAAVCVDPGFAVNSRVSTVVSSHEVNRVFPPDSHDAFVAVGYQNLNTFRRDRVAEFILGGYALVSVADPEVTGAPNTLVSRAAIVQTGAAVGQNSFVWGGAIVGHHSVIQEDCWISSGVIIAGNCNIGAACFLGVGAIVTHGVTVGSNSIVGAGAIVTKDIPPESVVIPSPSKVLGMSALDFNRLFPL